MSPVPSSVRPRCRESLSESVRQRIQAAILDGTFRAGERLHDDRLIEWLGVSRTPIRTALEKLAASGLVEMEPNRFTRVTLPTTGALADAIAVYGALTTGAARAVLPALGPTEVADFRSRISRLPELSACPNHPRGDAVVTAAELGTINDAVGFFARQLGNPALLAALNEVETRLAFFFGSLSVHVPCAAVETFARDSRRAVEARDSDALVVSLAVFLTLSGVTAA